MRILCQARSRVVALSAHYVGIAWKNLGYDKIPFFVPFLSFPWPVGCRRITNSRVQSAILSCRSPSPNSRRVELAIAPEEELYAQNIRTAILIVKNASVEEIIRSLQCDEACRGIPLSSSLVDSLISRFGDDWKSALGFFEWASLDMGYEHTQYAYDKMVDLLGKMRQFDLMWDLVHKMHAKGFVSIETIAKVMRRLAGARRFKDVVKLFDDLELLGIVKNTVSMNLLIDTLCKEKRVEIAHESFSLLKDHISPDAYTYNILVHGWCNANRLPEAIWTFQEMRTAGVKPSVITYSTVIQAYCNRRNFKGVYDVIDEMISEGCPPNIVTYTTIMNSLAKSRQFEEALNVVSRMKANDCKPDILFYNSLLNVLGRAGQLQEAFRVFVLEMKMNGVTHNLTTYNTMISICCEHEQEQNALNVLKEMEKVSCVPDLQTYRPLLKLHFSKGMLDENTDSLLNEMINKHHLSFDLDTYTLLINGLCQLGNVWRASHLFDEMINREIKPRIQTCRKLIFVAEQKNMHQLAERLKDWMNQAHKSSWQ